MLNCFSTQKTNAIPIQLVSVKGYSDWAAKQSGFTKEWLSNTQFIPKPGNVRLIPDTAGKLSEVIYCVDSLENMWGVGLLPFLLPEGDYTLPNDKSTYAIAWGLGSYQFTRYKKPERKPAKLVISSASADEINNLVASIYWGRDAINTPADDMGPTEFANLVEALAKEYNASLTQIIGDNLLKQNYASIYTVGRASDDAPRLLDLRWGDKKHPKITLVGKGVCFDTGGLDIKPSPYMLLMKKDMAGAAHVFALARMIMQAKLPICLRVLTPVVENAISGNAYRPGDIIKSRKGLTIEVGNTDCEGRVILADALTEAASENPELIIDITTLTGAARVALGTDLPAVFSNEDKLVNELIKCGEKVNDPMWRLPLYPLYREYLNSLIADINNHPNQPYAGAITAALFLKEFVPDTIPWMHFDMMAWNIINRPGRPMGAEVMALRALFEFLKDKYC